LVKEAPKGLSSLLTGTQASGWIVVASATFLLVHKGIYFYHSLYRSILLVEAFRIPKRLPLALNVVHPEEPPS